MSRSPLFATSYPRMVIRMVSPAWPAMTPRVLGSSTVPLLTTYPLQNLSSPLSDTSTWMPAKSFGTCTCVSAPGTISVGLVAEQPEPPDTADPAMAQTPIASALEYRLPIGSP